MEVLSEHQRIQALEDMDEDDSEGEESDDVCILHSNSTNNNTKSRRYFAFIFK